MCLARSPCWGGSSSTILACSDVEAGQAEGVPVMSDGTEDEVRTFWNEVAEGWRVQVGEDGDVNRPYSVAFRLRKSS